MKTAKPGRVIPSRGLFFAALLAIILAVLFWKSFLPGYVHFSNDGPLGQQNVAWLQFPAAITGMWDDLNSIGFSAGAFSPSLGIFIRWILGPVGYEKFLAPMALFILGFGAWMFFRQLRLSPLAAVLGALAATLNSTFFSTACWGVASQQIGIGMDFFALALVVSNTSETPALIRWTRLSLAGLAVGMNVIEAADVGAIFSLFVSAYVIYLAFAGELAWTRVERIVVWIVGNLGFVLLLFVILSAGYGTNYYIRGKLMVPLLVVPACVWNWAMATRYTLANRLAHSMARVGVIAIFAGFIATQTVASLVGSQITGIAGTGQDTETKAQHWDWASQWSQPKIETLGLFVPGLFGYRMDTPNKMMEPLQNAYRGGNYWGGTGRSPEIDRFFDSGKPGSPPPGMMRFSGGGDYAGILVALLAVWAIAQSLRRQNPVFGENQRRMIWFWSVLLIASLLLSFGRFAPFDYYKHTIYALPYFSTIRNPCKFILIFSWAIVILFAYGVHGLSRRYLEISPANSTSPLAQLKNWRMKVRGFDRNWTLVCVLAVIGSVLGWLIYAMEKPGLVRYLQMVGFPDEDTAQQIAAFSIGQVGWFILLFLLAAGLCTLIIAGVFAGRRAKLGGILLGTLLVMDLGRANLPYIIHWDYKQKYEIGSLNPIVDFLRAKPYEYRVIGLPNTPPHLPFYDSSFGDLYRIEWAQHHFPYYNIQSLDKIQMSRPPADLEAYEMTLAPRSEDAAYLLTRHWELTNTRYLLAPAGFLGVLNEQLDPAQHRFRIVQRFDVIPKPGIDQVTQLEQLTAVVSENGGCALFEFTGALPRAKLYSNWQVNTNDDDTLKTLASTNFDPWQMVLVSMPLPVATATNQNAGSVEFKSYAPKDILFNVQATVPAVLLLNDRFDPHWRVLVDGKPAELLRCNFIMRGVYLTAGEHTVEFQFGLPTKPLFVTLSAVVAGILLCGFLFYLEHKPQIPAKK